MEVMSSAEHFAESLCFSIQEAIGKPLQQLANRVAASLHQSAKLLGSPIHQSSKMVANPALNYAYLIVAPLLPLLQLAQFAFVAIQAFAVWQLQTFYVVYFLFTAMGTAVGSVLLSALLILFPPFWPLALLYTAWFIYDFRTPERGGRTIEYLRSPQFWKHFVNYFPMELVKTAELSPEHNYIIGSHPHGIFSMGTVATLAWNATGWKEKFPGITTRLATLEGQFWYPFRREYCYLTGTVSSSKESISYIVRSGKGKAVGIVLGGAQELLDSHPGNYDLTLLTRKGFVKIALETGAHIVPMYSFGEADAFYQIPNQRGSVVREIQRIMIRYMGFPFTLLFGRGIFIPFGMVPFRTPIHIVVGRPVEVEKTENPTKEQIEALHRKYCEALTQLFEEYKGRYGISEETHLTLY